MHMVDLYPTLLNLAGASLKQELPLDGMDVLACLTEGTLSPRKEILHNITPSTGALRMGDWKLVVNGSAPASDDEAVAQPKANKKKKRAAGAEAVELFNLADDPYEKNDLSSIQPEKLKELRLRYDRMARQASHPKNVKP